MPHVSDHSQRGATHGDFSENAELAQYLKSALNFCPRWDTMIPAHRECLDLIMTKIARIMSGDPDFADHWNDIEGYARLAKDRCSK